MHRGIELLLARWVLGELPPEDVAALATDALMQGCEAASVAVLAGLAAPTTADIQDELLALLEELHLRLPSKREALKAAVDGLAGEIVDGTVDPSDGAHRMWWRYSHDDEVLDDPGLSEQLLVFASLAVERDDENRPAPVIDAEVVSAARALLDAGGLRISDE